MLPVEGAEVTLGRPNGLPLYGWDNEYGRRTRQVRPFEGTRDLVTHARFLEFVRDGGYRRPELWTAAARPWLASLTRKYPLFWRPEPTLATGFAYRAMFDELPLPAAWPAEVCAFEGQAFCAWAGDGWRLPSEAEHALIAEGAPTTGGDVYAWRCVQPEPQGRLPTPVGACLAGLSAAGFTDAHGNVWEHLSDDFRPFDGFRPHAYYDDFSKIYFDDQHGMMAGAAWSSTGPSASRWYRNWFRRHFYQHAGFRMVRSR